MTTMDVAIRFQILLERLKSSQSRLLLQTVSALNESLNDVFQTQDIRALSLPQVTKLVTLVDQKLYVTSAPLVGAYLDSVRAFATSQIQIEAQAWNVDYTFKPSDINAALDAPIGVDGPDRGSTVDKLVARWWQNARTSIFGAVRRAAFEQESNVQIASRIRGTKAVHYKDGMLENLRRNCMTASNTVMQHVSSSIRGRVLLESEAKSVLWLALLERKTCARCGGLDYTPFGLDKGPRSPLHYGCRCIMVPIFMDTNTKHTEDSYYGWLKTQSDEFVYEALGSTRGKVFLGGGLTVSKFADLQLDKRFEPLTLDEFKKRAPSAFARAGV